ncbi:Beta-parvin [Fragariocoptes setiger]|uniref:Beta-parvin n=1 Tax=Fragariocoptes setiger TaxID=1670756 RepID=A0ABQ7S5I9_9ACAR|nr:Beta-parvin [Fragariocoptes setiger]
MLSPKMRRRQQSSPGSPLQQQQQQTIDQQSAQISLSQSQQQVNPKQESFLEYIGSTLGRKKKQREPGELTVEEVEQEGKKAIDGNIQHPLIDPNSPAPQYMHDNESRIIIDTQSRQSPQFKELVTTLANWINDELNDQRIIVSVKHLEHDLYDGQVLGKLVEKLTGTQLDVVEVTQNEDSQRRKLREVLETVNRIFNMHAKWATIKWSVEGIHAKNTVQIIHLLVTMIRHFRAPIRLPPNVTVRCNVLSKQGNNSLAITGSLDEKLTETYNELGMRIEPRDAFDTLFDHAPEKLDVVKRSLCNFVNRHLKKINVECFSAHAGSDLDPNQFSDGLLLIFLMASLENYFVPLGNIFTTPTDPIADMAPINGAQTALQHENYVNTSPIHKLHNVNVALQLMEDADVDVKQRVRAEDIVNADLKSTLRVLYMIFSKFQKV